MNTSFSEVITDLISQPGLGMFAWMCAIFFLVAAIFFLWAIKTGQFIDLEDSKLDIFDEDRPEDLRVKI